MDNPWIVFLFIVQMTILFFWVHSTAREVTRLYEILLGMSKMIVYLEKKVKEHETQSNT